MPGVVEAAEEMKEGTAAMIIWPLLMRVDVAAVERQATFADAVGSKTLVTLADLSLRSVLLHHACRDSKRAMHYTAALCGAGFAHNGRLILAIFCMRWSQTA